MLARLNSYFEIESQASVLVLAIGASAIAGLAISSEPWAVKAVLGLILAMAAAVSTQYWWGCLTPFVIVALYPAASSSGMASPAVMGALVLTLTLMWWAGGAGRPALPGITLAAIAVLGVAGLLLGFANELSLMESLSGSLVWAAGVITGASVASRPRAVRLIVVALSPLAVLAILEAAGLPSYWSETINVHFPTLTGERALSTFGHPLIAGGCFAIMAILTAANRWQSKLKWLLVSIYVAGALATVSRSAMVGLAMGIVVMFVMSAQTRKAALITIVLAAGAIAAILLGALPGLAESLDSRVVNRHESQAVREFAVNKLGEDFEDHPMSLLVGGGVGRSRTYLTELGGVGGVVVFDDQYVTWMYDYGALPTLAFLILIAIGIWRADPEARALGVPAVITGMFVVGFSDGFQWSSLGFFLSAVIGIASAVDMKKTSPKATTSVA